MDVPRLRAMTKSAGPATVSLSELRNYLLMRVIVLVPGVALVTFFTYVQHSLSETYCRLFYAGAIVSLAVTWHTIRHAKLLKRSRWALYSQFVIDTFIATAIIFGSGGPISPFLFLYLPLVMVVSILRSRSAALCVAVFSTLVYAAVVFAMTRNWLPVPDKSANLQFPGGGMALQVIGLLSAMVLIAVATDFLAKKLKYTRAQVEASRRELQEFTEHQRQLVDELPDAVITTGPDFTITSLNQIAGIFLGVDEAQVVQHGIFELLEDLDGTSSEIHKAKRANSN